MRRQLIIGRSSQADLVFNSPLVSRRHCLLTSDNGQIWAEDLGSTNGTLLNGAPLRPHQPQRLSQADCLDIGPHRLSYQELAQHLSSSAPSVSAPPAGEITIGRGPGNHLVLDHPQISRRHAKLHLVKGAWLLSDLGSTNGTLLNGHKISEATVQPGDRVSLGPYSFRVSPQYTLTGESRQPRVVAEVDQVSVAVDGGRRREPKTILDGVSLVARPGELIGLLGPSGAGKTTLLKVLTGHLRPTAGACRLNGLVLHEHFAEVKHRIGYLPQDSLIHPELTAWEALIRAGEIRLPSDTSREEIEQRVRRSLASLGLSELGPGGERHWVRVGSPEREGLSGGQKKRVQLAMELLSDPYLLVLDEPTSGLASGDAEMVMHILRRLRDQGRTVIVTLHQPTPAIYAMLDMVLYLFQGGTAFFGPPRQDAERFFGVRPARGPARAEDIMGALAAGSVQGVDWGRRYLESEYSVRYLGQRGPGWRDGDAPASPGGDEAARVGLRQLKALIARYVLIKSRDRLNTVLLLAQSPVIAGLISLAFHGSPPPHTVPLYLMVISALWFGTINAVREVVSEQVIYTRERMSNLSIVHYLLSKFLVLSALCLVQCLVLLGVVDYFMDLGGSFWGLLGALLLTALTGLALGLAVSALTRTQQQAIALVPLILLPMVILGGGMTPLREMNPATYLLAQAMPARWGYELAVRSQEPEPPRAAKSWSTAPSPAGAPKVVSYSLLNWLYGGRKTSPLTAGLILAGFCLGLLGLGMAALKRRDLP